MSRRVTTETGAEVWPAERKVSPSGRPVRRRPAAAPSAVAVVGSSVDATRSAAAPAVRPVRQQRAAAASVGNLLLRLRPDLSAAVSIWPWQLAALAGVVSFAIVLAVLQPSAALRAAIVVLTVPFLLTVILRLLAVHYAFAARERLPSGPDEVPAKRAARGADVAYPTYAVLVALYDEAAVVPGLVEALAAFDYPESRLAIRLVVEEKDLVTQTAIRTVQLPPHIEMLVVPDGRPRTKPRALNYALSRTAGEFVVIYDAEDLPEPDQLLRALDGFAKAPAGTGCLQARLNIVNYDDSWLSRQFTIEYTALFDCMLPTLERHGIPIPLGGTSNHFRRTALEAALAWDPYNVTEDADLGIRFARFGMRVGVIASTTWEEAPTTFRIWLGQRTRWLKGWMQTFNSIIQKQYQ